MLDVLPSVQLTDLTRFIDLAGVFGNALLGGAMARHARFDAIGFIVLAIISGMGGGIIRDVMLQRGTVVALTDEWYLVVALSAAAFAFIVKTEGALWDRIFPWVDALALGAWSAAGTLKALTFGLDWIPAVLLGTITAVGGGFVRDMVLRRVPSVLGGNTLYATCGAFGAMVMVAMYEMGFWTAGPVVATAAAAGLTQIARWRNWMLPVSYDWGGLRYETERYAQAIVRRGRRLRDGVTRFRVVDQIQPSRAAVQAGAEAKAAATAATAEDSPFSHRARRNRRRRGPETGQQRTVPGSGRSPAKTGGSGRSPAKTSGSAGTTGALPRVMRTRQRPAPGPGTPPPDSSAQ